MSDTYQPADFPDATSYLLAQQRQAVSQAMGSLDDDPEKAARAQELSEATGTHPALVYGDLDSFEAQHKAALTAQLLKSNAYLRQYINANPLAAKVSNDDWGQLDDFSQKMQKLQPPGMFSLATAAFQGFKEGFGQDELFKDEPESAAQTEFRKNHPFVTDLIEGAVAPTFKDISNTGELISRLFSGALGGLRGALATGYIQAGGSPGEAGGWANEITEMLGYHIMLGEHMPEVPETARPQVQDFVEKVGPYAKAGVEPPVGVHPLVDQAKAEQAKTDVQNLDDALASISASQTRERSPELAQALAKLHSEAKIGVSAEAVRKLYGDEVPTSDDGKLGWVPSIVDQLRTAEATGGDIEVPLADWLAKVEPDVAKELHDNIRVRPGGLTLEEAKDLPKYEPLAAPPPPDETEGKAANENQEGQLPTPAALSPEELDRRLRKSDAEHPEFRQVPWGVSAEFVRSLSYDDYQKMLAGEPLLQSIRQASGLKVLEGPEPEKFALSRVEDEDIEAGKHEFDINDSSGENVGGLSVTESSDKATLQIGYVSAGTFGGSPNRLGPSAVRDLLQQLRQEFPEAKTISGDRVSGARRGTDKEGERVQIRLRSPSEEDLASLHDLIRPVPKSFIPEGAKPTKLDFDDGDTIHTKFTTTGRDILNEVDPERLDGVPRALMAFFGDKLEKLAGDIPVHIVSEEDMRRLDPQRRSTGLHFIWDSGQQEIFLSEALANGELGEDYASHVIVHELVHGATSKALYSNPTLLKATKALMNETDAHLSELDPSLRKKHNYAFTNEHEFMAEAWSNPDFQETLALMPISDDLARALNLGKGKRTVWDAVREIVNQLIEKLIGVKVPPSILDGVLQIGKAIEHVGQEGEGKFTRRAGPEQPELPGMTRLEDRELFEKANAIGMTVKQYKRYQELIEKQKAEDLEFQKAQAQKEEALRQTKEWKENAEKVRGEVRSDISSRPDIAADEFLREGRLYGDKLKGRPRLDSDQLSAQQKAALPDDYHKPGGIHPDDAAGLFGYQTGGELVDHLAQLEKERGDSGPKQHFNRLVEDETNRRMQAQYGNLEQNILEAAKDHVVSQTQLDLLHEEVLALGSKAGGEMSISKADLKKWAKQEFDKTPISRHNTDKYLATAGKAGRAAEQALLEENPREAFKAKQQQYLAMLLANEAKKLDKERGQFDRLAKRMSRREVPSVSQEYTNFVHDILMRVGQQVRRSVQDVSDSIARGEQKTLEDFVQYKEGHDLREVPVADFLFDSNFRKVLSDLTAEQFRAVHDSIKTLVKNGRDELRIEREGNEADLAEVRGAMVDMLSTLPAKAIDVTKTARRGIGHGIRVAWASLLQMESIFNRWDRGDPNGVFTQYVMRPLAEAANYESALERKYSQKLKGIATKTKLSERISNNLFKSPLDGTFMNFTRKNLRAILQNVGNDSNMEKLAKGYNVTPEAIMQWLHANAKKEDWDWAQAQGDIFKEIKAEADRMYRKVSGIEPESIELRPVQTPHGTYDGWYHPVVYDPRFEGSSKKLMGGDALEQDNFVRATTPRGYTKQRTGYTAPISLDLDMTPSRMKSMLHDIAFRESVIQASKIFYAKDVRSAVTKHYGLEYRDLLVPYLRDVANQANFRSDVQAVGSRFSEIIRQNVIGTLIGLNPSTVMKHGPTAAMNSITEVGPMNFLRAVKDLMQTNDQTGELNWHFAMRMSEELQRRFRNYVETLKGAQEQVMGTSSLRDTILKIGATPVAISDLLSAVPTWLAQYRKSIADGAEHGTAIFEADRAVRRAHGSSVITNRPAAMRGGQMAQWLTSLYGFFSHILNRQFELAWKASDSIEGLKKGDIEDARKHLPSITAGFFSYIIFPALVEEAVTPLSNDEHQSWGKWAALTVAKGVSSSWPIIRDLADYALSQGRREPSVGLFSAAAKTIGDVVHDVPKGKEAFNKAHAGTTFQHLITAAGALSGLTNAQEGKSAKFIYNYATGQEHPRDASAWWRGIRTGTSQVRR